MSRRFPANRSVLQAIVILTSVYLIVPTAVNDWLFIKAIKTGSGRNVSAALRLSSPNQVSLAIAFSHSTLPQEESNSLYAMNRLLENCSAEDKHRILQRMRLLYKTCRLASTRPTIEYIFDDQGLTVPKIPPTPE